MAGIFQARRMLGLLTKDTQSFLQSWPGAQSKASGHLEEKGARTGFKPSNCRAWEEQGTFKASDLSTVIPHPQHTDTHKHTDTHDLPALGGRTRCRASTNPTGHLQIAEQPPSPFCKVPARS